MTPGIPHARIRRAILNPSSVVPHLDDRESLTEQQVRAVTAVFEAWREDIDSEPFAHEAALNQMVGDFRREGTR